ncbi:hypothetical protein CPB83DRAFT_836460 [Crepidotus variabilis]|uniref:Uncharacterized protein n=1 Tax=Crepidotus variabilis TaxID=179855 RepID=A0A9P6JPG6_9AGAR|nr:hypothetical protein CPB83DRAFT_836460 [Crepidotus variabilis]
MTPFIYLTSHITCHNTREPRQGSNSGEPQIKWPRDDPPSIGSGRGEAVGGNVGGESSASDIPILSSVTAPFQNDGDLNQSSTSIKPATELPSSSLLSQSAPSHHLKKSDLVPIIISSTVGLVLLIIMICVNPEPSLAPKTEVVRHVNHGSDSESQNNANVRGQHVTNLNQTMNLKGAGERYSAATNGSCSSPANYSMYLITTSEDGEDQTLEEVPVPSSIKETGRLPDDYTIGELSFNQETYGALNKKDFLLDPATAVAALKEKDIVNLDSLRRLDHSIIIQLWLLTTPFLFNDISEKELSKTRAVINGEDNITIVPLSLYLAKREAEEEAL